MAGRAASGAGPFGWLPAAAAVAAGAAVGVALGLPGAAARLVLAANAAVQHLGLVGTALVVSFVAAAVAEALRPLDDPDSRWARRRQWPPLQRVRLRAAASRLRTWARFAPRGPARPITVDDVRCVAAQLLKRNGRPCPRSAPHRRDRMHAAGWARFAAA